MPIGDNGDGLLSDEELAQLDQENAAAMLELAQQGVQLSGIAERYLASMIESLLSPSEVRRHRADHAKWLAESIAGAQEQIRKMKLMAGVSIIDGRQGSAPS
jgi:hypothetical protein